MQLCGAWYLYDVPQKSRVIVGYTWYTNEWSKQRRPIYYYIQDGKKALKSLQV